MADSRPASNGDRRARVLVAGATTLDQLLPVVVDEVAVALLNDTRAVRVAVTSIAPRDPAARAARQVSRLAAQRGISAILIAPGSSSGPTAAEDVANRGRAIRRALGQSGRWTISSRDEEDEFLPTVMSVIGLDVSPTIESVDQPYATGLWLELESRARRLRRQLTSEPDRQLIDAAMAAEPVATVVVARQQGLAIGLVGTDLLAVEVLARGLRSAMQPVGDRGLSPWEAPVVQRGIELGVGVTHPDRIDLESIWLGNPTEPGHDRLHRIVQAVAARAGVGRAASIG